jgi:hypothetical protein
MNIPAIWIHPINANEGFAVTFCHVVEIGADQSRIRFIIGGRMVNRHAKNSELASTKEKAMDKITKFIESHFERNRE